MRLTSKLCKSESSFVMVFSALVGGDATARQELREAGLMHRLGWKDGETFRNEG